MAAGGHFTGIGFVLAQKAAVRIPELKDREFAEYVLIGTLLSTAIAVAFGILVASVPHASVSP